MSSPDPGARRPPTAAEARALAHPTRLRILFACRDRALTNKDLAEQLGTTPGTIHYHLRPLVEEGFLRAEEPRPGPRGSQEQPYRSTGKSWQVEGDARSSTVLREVGAQEVMAAAEEDLFSLTRLGLSLPEPELRDLVERLAEMLEDAKSRSLDLDAAEAREQGAVERVAVFLAVHRTGPPPS